MTEPSRDTPVVLVLEDDDSVRELLAIILTAEGFAVRTARDAQEGVAALMAARPSAALLDMTLPGASGHQVLDALEREAAGTPVIVVTGSVEAAHEAADRIGAENVFMKPFEVSALAARVRAVVDPHRTGSEQGER